MKPPNFFLKKYHFYLHFVINSLFSHTLFYNLTEKGDSFTQTAAHFTILTFYLQFITQSKIFFSFTTFSGGVFDKSHFPKEFKESFLYKGKCCIFAPRLT